MIDIKKKIVVRKHSIEGGKRSKKVTYLYAPTMPNGTEYSGEDANRAFLFNPDQCFFKSGRFSGSDRSTGKWAYKQEVIDVKVVEDVEPLIILKCHRKGCEMDYDSRKKPFLTPSGRIEIMFPKDAEKLGYRPVKSE